MSWKVPWILSSNNCFIVSLVWSKVTFPRICSQENSRNVKIYSKSNNSSSHINPSRTAFWNKTAYYWLSPHGDVNHQFASDLPWIPREKAARSHHPYPYNIPQPRSEKFWWQIENLFNKKKIHFPFTEFSGRLPKHLKHKVQVGTRCFGWFTVMRLPCWKRMWTENGFFLWSRYFLMHI